MRESLPKISSVVITTGAMFFIIWKTWRWIEGKTSHRIKPVENKREGVQNDSCAQYISTKRITVVNTADEWEEAYKQLKKDLLVKKVLGLDCEWVQKNKVALLQLCSVNGFCVLVRLFKLQPPYPATLISLLADRSILKAGVAVVNDGHLLHRDYGLFVCGCVDLRYLVLRMRLQSNPVGLKGLASKVLNIDLNKDLAIRCSNWESENYSEKQINYAATDAAVGVDVFIQLVRHKMGGVRKIVMSSSSSSQNFGGERSLINQSDDTTGTDDNGPSTSTSRPEDTAGTSQSVQDVSLSTIDSIQRVSSNGSLNLDLKGEKQDSSRADDNSPDGLMESVFGDEEVGVEGGEEEGEEEDAQFWKLACSLCQGLVDVGYSFKAKGGQQPSGAKKSSTKKTSTASYSTRQRPLWDNCRLQAPDGTVLCTCDGRKAQWYINKQLGDKVCDDPLTVRLRFEPTSRPQDERNYYLQEKENQCVVCGQDKDYVRKFVIPFEYKKFFPSALKDHSSHDVLLLCIGCHRQSCEYDSKLRLLFAEECNAPVESGATSKTVLDHDLQKVRSAARALKMNRHSIPEVRVKQLEQILLDYFGVDVVSDDLIEQGADIDARQTADGYVPHGKRVVRHMANNGGLLAFQARWRQHFRDTMNPQFLPAYWSVDYVPEGWSGLQLTS